MRPALQGRVLGPAIAVGLLVGGVIWYLGAAIWWSLAMGLVAAAVIALWRAMPALEEPIWPKRVPENAPGARDDVHVLGWAVADLRGRVQPRALERVRAVARGRLAQLGLNLDAPADRAPITELIGARAYATLHSNVSHMPTQAALLACLDELDRAGAQAGIAPRPNEGAL